MDMDMSPDTLEGEDCGVNDLFFVVTVDVSFTTEQAVSDSLGIQCKESFEHYHQSARSTTDRDPVRL